MVIHGTELIMARRQIDEMIKTDPVQVTFRRKVKTETADGGYTMSGPQPLQRGPQQARLIPFKRRMTEFLANTEVGELPNLPYVLLGRYNLDVQRGDLFTVDGEEFEVKTLDISEREVKTLAHVDYYGGGDNG